MPPNEEVVENEKMKFDNTENSAEDDNTPMVDIVPAKGELHLIPMCLHPATTDIIKFTAEEVSYITKITPYP